MAALACLSPAQQTPLSPHLAYVYPAGAQKGTTVEIKVGGQLLQGATGVHITGKGIAATVGVYFRPLNQGQAGNLTQKLQDARQKLQKDGVRVGAGPAGLARVAQEAGITEEQLKLLELFRRERQDPKRQPNPQIAETVSLRLQIEPSAEIGMREIRLITPLGLSNPIRFEVGALPDVLEVQPPEPEPLSLRRGPVVRESASRETQSIAARAPFVVNGQVLPGEVDRYSFTLQAGQEINVSVKARALVPYIADAVPGWLQAVVRVLDPSGKEAAFADHAGPSQDPELRFRPASAGTYTLEIRDGLYRGREDFVYRIAVGAFSAPIQNANGTPEKEPNNDLAKAHSISGTVRIKGEIGKPGDADLFKLSGKAGQKIVAEVSARRLGSELDSCLEILDSSGKVLAVNDDCDDKGAALVTHQADSYLLLTLPKAGEYLVRIRDSQGRGGPGHTYQLRVGAPDPDFELRVVPSSITARAGTTVASTVYVLRKDGFTGEVVLSLENPNTGVKLGGGLVPAGVEKLPITFTVPGNPGPPVELKLAGRGNLRETEMIRPALAAEDMMQAFAYRHLVPAQSLMLSVVGQANPGLNLSVPEGPMKIVLGRESELKVTGGPLVLARLKATLKEGPEGLKLLQTRVEAGALVLTLSADPLKLKPGMKGNLIFDAFLDPPANARGNQNRQAAQRRAAVGQLPAVPFVVERA